MKLLSKEQWFSKLENLSTPFRKYGSFLPEQRKLLEEVYNKLTNSQKPILVFVAPTASGKTHTICLIARTLQGKNYRIAILVPNNYLKEEYEKAQHDVRGQLQDIDFLNIFEYLKTTKQYNFVLANEAHNLKTFLELDRNIVRSIDFTEKEDLFFDIANRHLPPNKSFIAKQLSFNSARELLDDLDNIPKFSKHLRPIIQNPTSWTSFIYIWRQNKRCSIKFVRSSDYLCKLKLPMDHMLMFSASPLSDKELQFYCGIPASSIERATPIKTTADWRKKQSVYFSVIDEFSSKDKTSLLEELIRETKTRTLILFNNFDSCKKTFKSLDKIFDNITMIPPAPLTINLQKFNDFLSYRNGTLLTASTVFWEGITIEGLKLVIITDPPYPRPTLVDLVKKKRIFGKQDITRRLQQGLGRIARRQGEYGIGILLFDIDKHCKEVQNIVGKNRVLRTKSPQCLLVLHKIFTDKSPPLDMFISSKCSESSHI